MVSKMIEKVYKKIENEEKLCVSVNYGAGHILDAVIPDNISIDEGIYIEGENLILNITNEEEFKVSFNDHEEEFVIEQGNVTYYLR